MRRLATILLWSVIAAAFIGPGTVTTAASAGSGFGYALLWALLFSTLACVALQEASARLTVVSGVDLGQALRRQYPRGVGGAALLLLVLGAIVLGCAAYEAGNILGGVAGAALAVHLPRQALALASAGIAAALLWFNAPRTVARLLSAVVAVMGIAFLWTAVRLAPPPAELLRASLLPVLPAGSAVLALGLVGTTVVPYNLFLGSGLASGQDLREMRMGLAVAVGLGGLISMAVLVVGAAVTPPFGYRALSDVLAGRLGSWASNLFALGLFGAGLSSAITAPLAAAITARSLFADPSDPGRWGDRSWRYRAVWLGVLATGLAFGLSDVRPIPAIILAQALNGVLLPLVATYLLLAVNDRSLMGDEGLNGPLSNAAMIVVAAIALLLGVSGLARAAAAVLGRPAPGQGAVLLITALVAAFLVVPITRAARRRRAP